MPDINPHDGMLRASPAERGVDTAALSELLFELGRQRVELHSFMLWRDGAVIAEGYAPPYGANRPHMIHSVTKSFTSMAVGLAVDRGLLSIDDRVTGFFPRAIFSVPSERLERMTVRHLLTMTSGHGRGISGGLWRLMGSSWVEHFFRQPMEHEPGEVFVYDSGASHILSAIVQKVTGQTTHEWLKTHILDPMGMSPLTWERDPEGICSGGNGISCTTADMIKLGVLHLQEGAWQGRQLLSRKWVAAATGFQMRDVSIGVFTGTNYLGPDEQLDGAVAAKREGYGFQWWRGPHNSFTANGLFGQYCFVLPDQRAVVAFTGGLDDNDQRIHRLIWDRLLPAMGGSPSVAAHRLAMRLPVDLDGRPISRRHRGRMHYVLAPNDTGATQLTLDLGPESCVLELEDARGRHRVRAGCGRWIEDVTSMSGAGLHHAYESMAMPVVAGSHWVDDATLVMEWLFPQTAFRDTLTCHLSERGIELRRQVNVSADKLVVLRGRLETVEAAE